MSTLVVIGYDDLFKAEEVRLKLLKMQKEYLVDLEDAVVATKDKNGKVKLHQIISTTKAGAIIWWFLGRPYRSYLPESAPGDGGGGRQWRGGRGLKRCGYQR